jgi:hypothetical protein
LDLAGVADEVAVQSRINDLQNQLVGQSLAASAADDQELTRFEEDVRDWDSFLFIAHLTIQKVPFLEIG